MNDKLDLLNDLRRDSLMGKVVLAALCVAGSALLWSASSGVPQPAPEVTAASEVGDGQDLEILQAHIGEVRRQAASLEPMSPPRFSPSATLQAEAELIDARTCRGIEARPNQIIKERLGLGVFEVDARPQADRLTFDNKSFNP